MYRAGNLLLGAGDLAAARRCAERAVAAAPTNRVLVNLLTHLQGRIASVAGEDDIAEPLLRSAYEAEPRNGRNVLDLARFLLARERIDETLELLDCASTLEGPRKAREHYAQEFAGLRERIGRFQKLQLQISRVQARHSLGPARVSSSTPTRAARGANSPA